MSRTLPLFPNDDPFVALDFETADNGRDSACAIALVRVEHGRIVERTVRLIRPPRRQFLFTDVHGISWRDVEHEPVFADLWPLLAPKLEGAAFIAAHNAPFDRSVLKACCEAAGLPAPTLPFKCTVQLARRTWNLPSNSLSDVCRHLGIELQHHEALSDAEACARIVLAARSEAPQAHEVAVMHSVKPETASEPQIYRSFRHRPVIHWSAQGDHLDGERTFYGVGGPQPADAGAARRYNHCVVVAAASQPNLLPPSAQVVLHLAWKMLMRGESPPLPRAVMAELQALAPQPGIGGPQIAPQWGSPHGSAAEEALLTAIAGGALGQDLAQLVAPQFQFSWLGVAKDHRWADFALLHPVLNGRAIIIEVDGEPHDKVEDANRDMALRGHGHEVFRLGAGEAQAAAGPRFDALRSRIAQLPPLPTADFPATAATHAMVGLLHAIGTGLLPVGATEWRLRTAGRWQDAVRVGLQAGLHLLEAFSGLYGVQVAPRRCLWVDGDENLTFEWDADTPWYSPAPLAANSSQLVSLRPVWLPVLAPLPSFPTWVEPVANVAEQDLLTLLEFAFPAKVDPKTRRACFLDGQREALVRCLQGRDSLVLLPTGGGKSLIFQLASLLLPGTVLVVAPLNALIADQLENLRDAGFDRAIAPRSGNPRATEAFEEEFGSGSHILCYVSPERLLIPRFQSAVAELRAKTAIPLVVIDEAHCVSEWGHDFRPAFIMVAKAARRLGRRPGRRAGEAPAVIGLTGTASRSVLRDLRHTLEIRDPDAVIEPVSFDRAELRFHVEDAPYEFKEETLGGLLRSLGGRLGLPPGTVFRTRGTQTACGIIFCPWAKKGAVAVETVAQIAANATAAEIGRYRGGSESFKDEARKAAADFRANRLTMLAATKGYGMGVDKPNVRYTIHVALPASLESFYQEAGRAGRDRNPAVCLVMASVDDEARARWLLDPALSLDQARTRYQSIDRSESDDIRNALYFHHNGFAGEAADHTHVASLLDNFGSLDASRTAEYRFHDDDNLLNAMQHGLQRLLVLGVVRNYRVDYARNLLSIDVAPVSRERLRTGLRDHIAGYNRGRAARALAQLPDLELLSLREAVLAVSRELIRFVYDTIEASRRRAIFNVWRWSQLGGDSELRQGLLDYLQESASRQSIVALLDAEVVELERWVELLEEVLTERDRREVVGSVNRSLEDYPDHPLLLACRAVLGVQAGEAAVDVRATVRAAIGSLRSKYTFDAVSEADLARFVVTQVCRVGFAEQTQAVVAELAELLGAEWTAGLYNLSNPDVVKGLLPTRLRRLTKNIGALLR